MRTFIGFLILCGAVSMGVVIGGTLLGSIRGTSGTTLLAAKDKEAGVTSQRLRNLEATRGNAKWVKVLRDLYNQDPENLMTHERIAIQSEYADVMDILEMSETERKQLPLSKSASFAYRAYLFSRECSDFARRWGLSK